MIYLFTGTPGAGKTSNTLWDFLFSPEYKERKKYATYIKDFDYEKHGVTQLENVEKWEELPDGSLILVDEADQFFPPSARSSSQADFMKNLPRHRHRGFDFLVITQNGRMVNTIIRDNCHMHTHYHRGFGSKHTKRYVWTFYQDKPNSTSAQNLALVQRVKVNPDIFKLYTSTTMDTQHNKVPRKWIFTLALVPILILAAIYNVYYQFVRKPADHKQQQEQLQAQQVKPVQAGQVIQPAQQPQQPAQLSIESFKPRIQTDPSTAPIYDQLTTPSDFPRVAACIAAEHSPVNPELQGCHCYTQQGTPIDMPRDSCFVMIKKGWFDRWKTQRARQDTFISNTSEESSSLHDRAAHHQLAMTEQQQPNP